MNHDRMYSSTTQVFWTCDALLKGRVISHKTEIREVRGWRLGAIVHTLKHKYKWPILVEYRGPENVAYYSLASNTDRTRLKFPRSAKSLGETGAAT
jgi:hypothetical protein